MDTHPAQAFPRISIITPSLNQGRFIAAAIRSVLSQDYPALEYIVMDGGSTDGTLEVLKEFAGSPQLQWVSEPDRGQTDAINKGLRRATGSIVGYLNADDLLLPGALAKVAAAFMQKPGTAWVTGKCTIIDEDDREIRKPITAYKNLLLGRRSFSLLLMTNYISQPATFWGRDLLLSEGFLDEDLRYVMDYEYFLRLFSKCPPVYIPEYLAAFKIHRASKTTSTGHKSDYVDEERLIIGRHARAGWQVSLHDAHRRLMTLAYSLMNRGG